MSMDQRVPQPVQLTLREYLWLVNEHFPDLISAIYVVGSIAFGEFNERFSDNEKSLS